MGRLVSQCAAAIRIAFVLPRRLPSAAHAVPAAPASRACIGEPCEMKTLGRGTIKLKGRDHYVVLSCSFGIRPSACMASFTFGRAATRFWKAWMFGHFDRSICVGLVQFVS